MRYDPLAVFRATMITIAVFLFGEVDNTMITLCTFVVLDYLSGVIASYITGELSSKTGFKGIAKKVFLFILVAVAVKVDIIMSADGGIRFIVICIMIGNEGVSILENATRCGIPGTEFLYSKLSQLRDSGKDKD